MEVDSLTRITLSLPRNLSHDPQDFTVFDPPGNELVLDHPFSGQSVVWGLAHMGVLSILSGVFLSGSCSLRHTLFTSITIVRVQTLLAIIMILFDMLRVIVEDR